MDALDSTQVGYRRSKPGWHVRSAAGVGQKKERQRLTRENADLRAQLAQIHERILALEQGAQTTAMPVKKTGKGAAKK